MRVEVQVRDKKKNRAYWGMIDLPSDRLIRPFILTDENGKDLKIDARSDHPTHWECFIGMSNSFQRFFGIGKAYGKWGACFCFDGLKAGDKRIMWTASNRETGKFIRSPWRVSIKQFYK